MVHNDETILGNLAIAVNMLERCPEFSLLIPEVRVNLVYALPGAKTKEEVAAVEGRITAVRGLPRASGPLLFGASDHMARLIIEARKYDLGVNAGINFKCDDDVVEVVKQYCAEKGLAFGRIDRSQEPAEIIQHDGTSMPWKIAQLVRSTGSLPRVFYEGEGWGKEPLFVILGNDAVEVVTLACAVASNYQARIREKR